MSDAARPSLKISREGLVLIKSFEGFRPRALARDGGGWIIGYGHTVSAREGATVSEADAELLLRYDLLPVEKAVNETVPTVLNQHQFDALVSFAFSVGVDRFAGSDVRQCLTDGAPERAADAMMDWPEPPLRELALRRRAAERALFVADPDAPVALSDLLTAPIATAAGPAPSTDDTPEATEAVAATESAAPPEPPVSGAPEAEPASLPAPADDEPVAPRIDAIEDTTPDPAVPDVPVPDVPVPDVSVPEAPVLADASGPESPEDLSNAPDAGNEPTGSAQEPLPDAGPAETESPAEGSAPVETGQPAESPGVDDLPPTPAAPPTDPVAMAVARYAPYSASMIGPLPYLQLAKPRTETPDPAPTVVDEAPDSPIQAFPSASPVPDDAQPDEEQTARADVNMPVFTAAPAAEPDTPEAQVTEQAVTEPEVAEPPATDLVPTEDAVTEPELADPEPELAAPAPAIEHVAANEVALEVTTGDLDHPAAADAHDTTTVAEPTPINPADAVTASALASSGLVPVETLVLTAPDEQSQPVFSRPLWAPEQRTGPETQPASLFGDELSLIHDGGPLMRHEVEPQGAARLDWSETGAFVTMGAVGLTAFGASMAAFRLASEQSNGGSETTMIAWVLAVIGGACVGVSSFNLYRRWGLPGGD